MRGVPAGELWRQSRAKEEKGVRNTRFACPVAVPGGPTLSLPCSRGVTCEVGGLWERP